MNRGTAITIIKHIDALNVDPEDKLTAIQEVIDMETINSVTKANLVDALRWLIEDYI